MSYNSWLIRITQQLAPPSGVGQLQSAERNESSRDYVAPTMGRKRTLIAAALAAVVVLTTFGVGSAQEGGLRNFTESAFRLVSDALNPSPEQVIEADQEVDEATVITVKPDPAPITYANGFTEGDVLESSGVPTYSAPEFVPTGPDAPKEGEISPCVKEPDIQECEARLYRESWERERPEGPDWVDLELTDDEFFGWYVPPLWVNSVTGETRASQRTSYYLYHNAHKHATGISFAPRIIDSGNEEWPKLVFEAKLTIANTSYETSATPEMYPLQVSANFIDASSGEKIEIWSPAPEFYYDVSLRGRDHEFGHLPGLNACQSGIVEFTVTTAYGNQTFDYETPLFRMRPPAGLSCDKPSLAEMGLPFGWVYAADDNGELILDSFYTNGGYAVIYGAPSSGLENSFLQLKAPSNYMFTFQVSEVVETTGSLVLKFGSQSHELFGDYPFGTYVVNLWLKDSEGVVEVFRLDSVEISRDWNSASYYYPDSARP